MVFDACASSNSVVVLPDADDRESSSQVSPPHAPHLLVSLAVSHCDLDGFSLGCAVRSDYVIVDAPVGTHSPSVDFHFVTSCVNEPPRLFHFAMIALKSWEMPSERGRLRALRSAWGLAVLQRNFDPSR